MARHGFGNGSREFGNGTREFGNGTREFSRLLKVFYSSSLSLCFRALACDGMAWHDRN